MSEQVFTDEQTQKLKDIIAQALKEDFDRRREQRIKADQAEAANVTEVDRTYLISYGGHAVGIPDTGDTGNVTMHHALYIRCKVKLKNGEESDWAYTEHSHGWIVARGDGRLMKTPYRIRLFGYNSKLEVPDGYLENLEVNQPKGAPTAA